MLTRVAVPLVGAMLLTSASLAQTTGPSSSEATVSALTSSTEPMTQEKVGQWRASKLAGLAVYNEGHQRLGEVKDVLIDRDGRIDAVVIGVGGFLGFDEHDVALPFGQFSWAESRGRGEADMPRAVPDHAVVNMTKDQLLALPLFHFARRLGVWFRDDVE